MQNQLNEFLEKNGVGTHTKTKKLIAKALGIADYSADEQSGRLLLRRLELATSATLSNTKESFVVETASFDGTIDPVHHDDYEVAKAEVNADPNRKRVCRVITVRQLL